MKYKTEEIEEFAAKELYGAATSVWIDVYKKALDYIRDLLNDRRECEGVAGMTQREIFEDGYRRGVKAAEKENGDDKRRMDWIVRKTRKYYELVLTTGLSRQAIDSAMESEKNETE